MIFYFIVKYSFKIYVIFLFIYQKYFLVNFNLII